MTDSQDDREIGRGFADIAVGDEVTLHYSAQHDLDDDSGDLKPLRRITTVQHLTDKSLWVDGFVFYRSTGHRRTTMSRIAAFEWVSPVTTADREWLAIERQRIQEQADCRRQRQLDHVAIGPLLRAKESPQTTVELQRLLEVVILNIESAEKQTRQLCRNAGMLVGEQLDSMDREYVDVPLARSASYLMAIESAAKLRAWRDIGKLLLAAALADELDTGGRADE